MPEQKIYLGSGKKAGTFGVNAELDFGQLFNHLANIGADKKSLSEAFKAILNATKDKDGFFNGVSKKDGKAILKLKLSILENKDKQYSDYSISLNTFKPQSQTNVKQAAPQTELADLQTDTDDLPF